MNRLQEINSQPQSMVKGLFKDDPWTQRFKEMLGERDYVAIKSLQMQGLLLVLFTKRQHLLHIREVEPEYTRTGLGGMWVRIVSLCTIHSFRKFVSFTQEKKPNHSTLGQQRCCEHSIQTVWCVRLFGEFSFSCP